MHKCIDILLVEDSPADIRLVKEALKDIHLDFKLTVCTDGADAIAQLSAMNETNASDVILLDLNLPKMNGHQVLNIIKKNPTLNAIPVVLLTVSQNEEDIKKALDLKMNYYLCKPVDSQKLGAVLKTIESLWD